MPWWSGLAPEVIRELRNRYPGWTLDEIGIEAMQRPGYAADFAQIGAKIHTDGADLWPYQWEGREFPMITVPPKNAVAFRDLVVAVMLTHGAAPPEADDLVRGLPYLKADYEAAGKLHKAGKMTVDGIEKRRELSTSRAYRIYRQFMADAVIYDEVGLRPGSGYRWDPLELEKDPSEYKLIRA